MMLYGEKADASPAEASRTTGKAGTIMIALFKRLDLCQECRMNKCKKLEKLSNNNIE